MGRRRNYDASQPELPFEPDDLALAKGMIPISDETSIIQPVTVALMRQGYSKIQNRALICVIDKLQSLIHELLNDKFSYRGLKSAEVNTEGKFSYQISLSEFGVPKNNYKALRDALKNLSVMPVQLPYKSPTGKMYDKYTHLCSVYIPKDKYSSYVIIEIEPNVAQKLLSLDFGHQYLYKSVILHKTSNKYSQRLYLLITAFKRKGKFEMSTATFRNLLMIENKYKEFRLLAYNVLEPARKELHELAKQGLCDCYFDYKKVYLDGKRKAEPDKLEFHIIESPTLVDKENQEHQRMIREKFREMLERHFLLPKDLAKKYAKKITKENYAAALEKFMTIMNYVNDNAQPVFDRRSYIIASLDNFFKEVSQEDEKVLTIQDNGEDKL